MRTFNIVRLVKGHVIHILYKLASGVIAKKNFFKISAKHQLTYV